MHEYLCVNPKSITALNNRYFSHAICDSGVHFFHENPLASDYPSGYLEDYLKLAKKLAATFQDRIWITVPDYPDDYHPGQFGDNVEKTLINIERFANYVDIPWMPTIQARFGDIRSFEYCCKEIRAMQFFDQVAIGTVCKIRNVNFILQCCRVARRYFPDSWIHAFGPPLNSITRIKNYANSFDSTAWTFPRSSHKASCKTALERKDYFNSFVLLLSARLKFNDYSILDFVNVSQ